MRGCSLVYRRDEMATNLRFFFFFVISSNILSGGGERTESVEREEVGDEE